MIDPIVASPNTAAATPARPVDPDGVPFDSLLAALGSAAPDLSLAVTRHQERGADSEAGTGEEPAAAGGNLAALDDEIATGRLGVMALVVEAKPDPIAPLAGMTPSDGPAANSSFVQVEPDTIDLSVPADTLDISMSENPSPAVRTAIPEEAADPGLREQPERDDVSGHPSAVPSDAEIDLGEEPANPTTQPGSLEDPDTDTGRVPTPAPTDQPAVAVDQHSRHQPQAGEVTTQAGDGRIQVELVGPGQPPAGRPSTPPGRTPADPPTRIAMTSVGSDGRALQMDRSSATPSPDQALPGHRESEPTNLRAAAPELTADRLEVHPPLAPRSGAPALDRLRPPVSQMAERIESWIKATANTPPPRSITLRGAELHGLSIRVSVHADGVAIQLEGASGDDIPWMRHVIDRLHGRGIDVNEFTEYDSDGDRRPLWNEDEERERRRRRPDFDPLLDEYTA